MLRLACFLLIAATMIGALMPSRKTSPTVEENGVIYTPQSSGSSYRVASESGSGDTPRVIGGSGGSIHLQRESDGHFYVDARINGAQVHFLVDTGASGVALTRTDARSAGLALDTGTEAVGEGASGKVMGQWVRLDRVELGGRTASAVEAVVLEGGTQSLLGQTVLREFDIEVHGDEMVLR